MTDLPIAFRLAGIIAVVLLLATLLAGLAVAWIARGPVAFRLHAPRSRDSDAPPVSENNLRSDVHILCTELSPRVYEPAANLERVERWIVGQLRGTGLDVTEQEYRLRGAPYRNVIASREGSDPARGAVIIGAHYDTCGPYPGADDNASGVAVLLELARSLAPARPRSNLMLVAFVNEEPPFFGTDDMGSAHLARKLAAEKTRVRLMVALDLVGYFSSEAGSQKFPSPLLRLLYPGRGDFIAVVGDLGAGPWIQSVRTGMRSAGAVPVLSFRGPSFVPGIHWSDHYSFRKLGLPGVMVTDTAFLRNPNYHRETDTPDTLDYRRMAGVVRALLALLEQEG